MLSSGSEAKIRKAKPADAKALAEVFRLSWQQAYLGIIPHAHLESMIKRRGHEWWMGTIRSGDGLLVLEHASRVAGYATFGAARVRGPYQGEIYELYLTPTYQGLGFGEHLFESCRHIFDERRQRGLIVWALAENSMATDFYWRRGGRPVAQTFDRIGGAKLEKIAFAWTT
ncbi:MAG TPA: GNAT family N-acetyltransferase [Hyphomicrobiaceae bacterium]|nr:GNAT family N-acetyltransferase [Hyphomicrobiaceae bacterium]